MNINVPYRTETVDISTTDYTFTSKKVIGIYVGGAGAVKCRLWGDAADQTFAAVPVGTVLWGAFKSITRTGTAATNIVGLISAPTEG